VTPESLVRTLEEFLASARDAQVIEDGAVAFDLTDAKYSISGEYNKCLLHIWSAERNLVRRVLDAHIKNDVLKLVVQRFGQNKPAQLEICRQRDRRTASTARQHRLTYARTLKIILARHFPEYAITDLRTSMDLKRSFGPIYTRGLIKRGQSAFALIGVNDQETQTSIDGALSFGILWLDLCRHAQAGRCVVEGLKIFAPPGSSSLIRERMACLSQAAAKWELYELDQRAHSAVRVDLADRGNLKTRLVRFANPQAAYGRFASPVIYIHELMPECDVVVLSPAELAFRHFGLEFARARLEYEYGSVRATAQVFFGLGAAKQKLTEKNRSEFARLVHSIGEVRHPEGPRDHILWRMHPERWLESLVLKKVHVLDQQLAADSPVYSQVPAFSASDRAMIDVLTCTRQGRLVVIELKADEDIHLPLQGLDYWSRVCWHHQRSEFQKFGYFAGMELSPEPPLLFLVAPTLRVHPATDTILRYVSPAIAWTFIGIDERWRENVRPVFRKRSAQAATRAA
jgi:hypothetical protein